jgi:hypothetical protein
VSDARSLYCLIRSSVAAATHGTMGLDDYHVLELIGEGSFGKVTPVRNTYRFPHSYEYQCEECGAGASAQAGM